VQMRVRHGAVRQHVAGLLERQRVQLGQHRRSTEPSRSV
jgi:hypothetical protein